MYVVLGLQEAHDASAAVMVDGKVVSAAQEERFSGLKGDYGYPRQAIAACLKTAGITVADIDEVALATKNWNPVLTKIKRNANFTVDDWVEEQHAFWKPGLLEGKQVNYYHIYREKPHFRYDETYPMDHLLDGYMDKREMEEMQAIRLQTVARELGVAAEKIRVVTHEDCHSFYAYFSSPFRGKVLAVIAEGCGDYSNGNVSVMDQREGRTELASNFDNHIGHIYQYVCLLLGLKPSQHEYKVMGLAPYANAKELEKSYKVFERVLKVDGLNIVYDQKPKDLYFHFRERLEGHRFDGIAGAVQKMTERLLCQWVKNGVRASGLNRVVFSGGVAQNIKAGKSLMELDGVNDIFIPPAAGDTSVSIGACYYSTWRHLKNSGGDIEMISPIDHLYLGPEFGRAETRAAIEARGGFGNYDVSEGATAADLARLIADGKIIARCSGRMEFGLRALGNRSIMADPRSHDTVRKINQAIKFRDFWMPFTPSLLKDRADDYILNPKNVVSRFMTMAFESTERARRDLIAALHPADFTARPQVMERRENPDYYDLLKEFERLTGVGGILNTSFNLHGLPIVLGPREALYTLENSELDGLFMNGFLVLKKKGDAWASTTSRRS